MTDEIEDWLNPELPVGALNDSAPGGEDRGGHEESEQSAGGAAPGAGGTEQGYDEAEVILTADGKHAIPFKVLQDERAQRTQLQAQLDQVQAQLAALQSQGGDQGQAGAEAAATEADLSASDWQAVLADAQADGDDEIVRVARAGLAMAAKVERFEAYLQAQEAQQAQTRSQAIAAAMQANPDMALWSGSDAWMDRAQAVEQAMLAVPGSALNRATDWNGYMSALAQATAAAYPDMPRATPLRHQRGEESDGLPSSLSVLPSGVEPGTTIRSVEDLGRMPRGDASTHLDRLMAAGKLFDFLDGMPVGSLNASGHE